MKKKEYERPTTQVVELKQQAYLLQASGNEVLRTDYGEPIEGTWGE